MAINIFKELNFHPLTSEWFERNFEQPSPPQIKGWPSIASGNHTLILAPTGSGKTLAAFLWSIDHLVRLAQSMGQVSFINNPLGVHTLYISPLKALNNDIQRNLREPLQGIHRIAFERGYDLPEIRTAVRSGDTPSNERQSMLRKPPHILITTPESFYLLLTSEKGRRLFSHLKYLIVDEIHALSSNKRGVHLSLSIERMMPLCQDEPIRIGLSATQRPLERIAAFLGGQIFEPVRKQFRPRPVQIVDCGQRRDIDIQVISAVKKFENLPDDSIWQPVYELLYKLILSHKTTLIFANMRAQTEKIARNLNDLQAKNSAASAAPIALAHHGSISRETRNAIEDKLKTGKIPAVVATASLELGIDIGSIDLVVHLESPKSIAAALQRVGRSGHLISAKSKGRIIPLHPADFDDSVALAKAMLDSEIEELTIPENALDVLAQQIVAEVAMRDWQYQDLYNLFRQSYCYRHLSPLLFDNVVAMLQGRYSDNRIHFLKARLSWDKINNQLTARKGSRLMATMNGGTIPDRGYYGVYLKDSNIRLGEVEEEFVNETKVGEAFFLGNSEWRLDSITNDRILVTAVAAIKPKAPFWKGDVLFREFSTSQKIAQFRAELISKIDQGKAVNWLITACHCDEFSAQNLIAYIHRQREQGAEVATHHTFIGEWTIDRSGAPLFLLHCPVGARVSGLWAVAMAAGLENKYHTQVQYSFDDDGFLLRFLETADEPPIRELFKLSPPELEQLLFRILPESPMFLVQFRYNVSRALILPRSQAHKRIPLWLQRLRAADLIQVVKEYPDFPILLETFRTILHDVFDIGSLNEVLKRINEKQISIKIIHTSYPSPMASGLVFKLAARAIYEYDVTRQPAQPLTINTQLLQQLINQDNLPAIISADLVQEMERHWQFLHPQDQAKSMEEVYIVIDTLGPITEPELAKRVQGQLDDWLGELEARSRIVKMMNQQRGWISKATEKDYSKMDTTTQQNIIMRFLSTHGPTNFEQIKNALDFIPAETITPLLFELKKRGRVIFGKLIEGNSGDQWCEMNIFFQLYRMAIGRRRINQQPADRSLFNQFLFTWHGLTDRNLSLREIFEKYNGYLFPFNFFEREILLTRLSRINQSWSEIYNDFQKWISAGEITLRLGRTAVDGRRYQQFIKYGEGNLFNSGTMEDQALKYLSSTESEILTLLKKNGASRFRDLELGLSLPSSELIKHLAELCLKGFISCDNYGSLLSLLKNITAEPEISGREFLKAQTIPMWMRSRNEMRPKRTQIEKRIQDKLQLKEGRFFSMDSVSVQGKDISPEKKAEMQARLLLGRYGILIKEWYRHESGFLPWYSIFQTLKRLEWQGVIRRGYFVAGLGGVQFALPEALDLLHSLQEGSHLEKSLFVLLSTIDPALPYGRSISWNLKTVQGEELSIVRQAGNHLAFENGKALLYMESYARRIWILKDLSDTFIHFVMANLKEWLRLPEALRPRKRIVIEIIDSKPATENRLAVYLQKAGFEKDGDQLVLWPSACL